MPNLPDRNAREAALAAALVALFASFRADVERGAADWYAFASGVAEAVRGSLASTYAAAASALGSAQEVELDDTEAKAEGYAVTVATIIGRDVAERTRAGLQDAVSRGGDIAPLFSDGRANGIAISETTRAISEGESFAATAIAALTRSLVSWRWRTQEDDQVCSICGPLHGQREPNVQPPAHPNCRCDKEYSFSLVGTDLARGI